MQEGRAGHEVGLVNCGRKVERLFTWHVLIQSSVCPAGSVFPPRSWNEFGTIPPSRLCAIRCHFLSALPHFHIDSTARTGMRAEGEIGEVAMVFEEQMLRGSGRGWS